MVSSDIEAYFDPDLLGQLQAIFDQAWQEIGNNGHSSGKDVERTRTDLAQMIILAHRSGLSPPAIKRAIMERLRTDQRL